MGDSGGAVPAHATVQGAGERLQGQTEERRHEEEGPPGQLTQVHGHLPQAAHILLTLRRLYLVRQSGSIGSIGRSSIEVVVVVVVVPK